MRGILVFSLLAISLSSHAHPVTYEDGVMAQSMFRSKMSKNGLFYSFDRNFAAGLEVARFDLGVDDAYLSMFDLNALVKRWNLQDAQGNIYLMTGAGAAFFNEKEEFAGKVGIEADYETREFYTLAQYQRYWFKGEEVNWYQYRIGFAPYVGGYEDLHTWAILQFDYNKSIDRNVEVTPFLRFFYKNILWEVGGSIKGNIFFQFMVHL